MNVTVIGCSTSWTDRPTSSYCIDGDTLVDCGEGTLKYYDESKVDFYKIKNIFITHFHSDHTLCLVQFFCQYISYAKPEEKKTLTIYGGKGLKKYLNYLLLTNADHDDINIEDYINIVELEDYANPIHVGKYDIKLFKFVHGKLENTAYVFDDGESKVGFSGDLGMQDGIDKFISCCDAVFLECCGEKSSGSHLGYNDYKSFENLHKNVKFFAIHCVNDVYLHEKELDIICAHHSKSYEL